MEKEIFDEQLEYKTIFEEDGSVRFVKKSEEKKGKKSRNKGSQFEARVRKDLEDKGFIVGKWTNNVDLEIGKIIPSKRIFKRFGIGKGVMTIGTGFPDFIAFQRVGDSYKIIGVEVKVGGKLDKVEKEKCKWLIEKEVFNDILVAKKKKEGRLVKIEYIDAKEILSRMR